MTARLSSEYKTQGNDSLMGNSRYQLIIAEVFYSDRDFGNPACNPCNKLVSVACVFDRHRFGGEKLVPQNKALKNVYLI